MLPGWPEPRLIGIDRNVCFVFVLYVFDIHPSDL